MALCKSGAEVLIFSIKQKSTEVLKLSDRFPNFPPSQSASTLAVISTITMTRPTILLLIVCLLSCKDTDKRTDKKLIATDNVLGSSQFETTTILCDSIYPAKGYIISLSTFDTLTSDETKSNALFSFRKKDKGQLVELFRDSIYNNVHDVLFEDYNNDGVKDILVQSYSDARSNWTYYLYLIDTTKDILQEIKGFEAIKNPKWNSEFQMVENYVMSGMNWTSFYEIQNDSIRDFKITVQDSLNDENQYERDYKKAIETIKQIRKNNR
jgi:hypothetical protein